MEQLLPDRQVVCSEHGGCDPSPCFDLHHGARTVTVREPTREPWRGWFAALLANAAEGA